MTAAPGMRELAHRLLTYEAGADKTSVPMESPTIRVYEKLRRSIGEFVGAAGIPEHTNRPSLKKEPLQEPEIEDRTNEVSPNSDDGAGHGL